MIVEYIRYTIDTPRQPAFEAAYARARGALEASEHCLRFELARASEDPSSYVVRIEWDSLEGHLVSVVHDTMQPDQVSLWLRAPRVGMATWAPSRPGISRSGS